MPPLQQRQQPQQRRKMARQVWEKQRDMHAFGKTTPHLTAGQSTGAAAVNSSVQQDNTGTAATGRQSSSGAGAGPQTGEQWIEYLIAEMSAACGIADARVRAARVLQAFESFTKSAAAKESEVGCRFRNSIFYSSSWCPAYFVFYFNLHQCPVQ